MGAGFKVKQQLKMFSQNVYLPAVYEMHRADKVETGLVVFADAHHDKRPEAMELLYRALRRVGDKQSDSVPAEPKIQGSQTVLNGSEDVVTGKKPSGPETGESRKTLKKPAGKLHIVQMYLDFSRATKKQIFDFSTQFMTIYAKASVVVICDNFLPVASCRKKKETLVVQLWHACGCFKKFGYDAKDDIPEGYKGDVFRNMDLVTVSAEAAVGPFCSAMHKLPAPSKADLQGSIAYGIRTRSHTYDHLDQTDSSILTEQFRQRGEVSTGYVSALGVSRTDLYFPQKWRDMCVGNFRMKYPGSEGRKVVLWAPTFRGNAGVPELMDLDVERLQQELGDDYLVLTRVHPHMKEAQKAQSHNCPIPTELLYPVVDVLIADYSSLIYEYLLVSRIRRDAAVRSNETLDTKAAETMAGPGDIWTKAAETMAGSGDIWTNPAEGAGKKAQQQPMRGIKEEQETEKELREGSGQKEGSSGRLFGALVLYVPDLDQYESERGFYMDIREIPGTIVKEESKLVEAVRSAAAKTAGTSDRQVDHFLEKYMSACDGHATERIAGEILRHMTHVPDAAQSSERENRKADGRSCGRV